MISFRWNCFKPGSDAQHEHPDDKLWIPGTTAQTLPYAAARDVTAGSASVRDGSAASTGPEPSKRLSMGSINGISPATEQVGSLAPSDKFEGTRSSADEHVKEKRLATNASITVASIGTIISASITASITVARKFLQRFRWKSKDRDFNGLDDSFLHFSGHEAQPHDTTPTQAHFTDAPPAQVLSTDQAPEKTSSTTDTSLSARRLANHASGRSIVPHTVSTCVSSGAQVPGPTASRQHGSTRAESIAGAPNPASSQLSSSRKTCASHAVVAPSLQQRQQTADDQTGYHDVYSHPAAVAYAAAHPRRQLPRFGPYFLLQTLSEGEFGKVKLGLHSPGCEEVTVKLIRRDNVDSTALMSKVKCEIEVLRTLQHPNIIRLYEVIETTKYTGIITEYASGSELFDHILAHRYLKERDAAKLFSQIISGVWYIHRKKIVHRDLKIENLLLDCHLNVIITGFRFANRFEHQSNDLMKTSCGSPYYAAPEVILSEGPYVGSAVDIWSCGVILYAMLAGYLPFGDDPANPDGDINLLYKYIVSTPLSFPNYISPEARNLLSTMLVPNRTRRADLPSVMGHTWLAPYAHVFQRDVGELERDALEKHQAKRLARYRRMNSKSVEPIVDKPRTDQQGITQPTLVCQQGITRPTLTCVIPISCFSHLDVPPPGEEAKPRDATQIQDQFMSANIDEAQPPPVLVLAPPTPSDQARHVHPQRTSSTATDTSLTTTTTSLASRVRRFLGLDSPSPPKSLMQVHRGPVDTKLITTSPPDEAIKHVHNVLVEMGIQIFQESDYRFRCERPERVKTSASIQLQETNGPSGGEELAAVSTGDSATSNGVDRRYLPIPPSQLLDTTGGMPEGFLTPHQSSHVSGNSGAEAEPGESSVFTSAVLKVPVHEPIYGTAMIDVWDTVRFSVELTRIEPLEGVFSLDIRRFKGNLKSYKFLYDTIRERVDLVPVQSYL